MRKIFWENPYQETLLTQVAEVHGNELLFKETIAYSFCGGQESDETSINDTKVLSSRIEGNNIYYTLPAEHGLAVGNDVIMQINWPDRYRKMRLHFAAELILEIITQDYGYEKLGANISPKKSRIDFKLNEKEKKRTGLMPSNNISVLFPAVLERYNRIIAADLPIEKGYFNEEEQLRYWKIEGFAEVPCGGTHVNSTREVGEVRLKRQSPGKDLERIEIYIVDDFIAPSVML